MKAFALLSLKTLLVRQFDYKDDLIAAVLHMETIGTRYVALRFDASIEQFVEYEVWKL